ncbi:unnamed protein product [Oppiella nova]|uniref:Syntaxin N-terminal domain-containing protein n=1 Tax=Oppiella nova TaxID=334625 RepID=A0A7R9LS79_9ACAR|nr:unnamed protein product [Oppiella nova]CAG2166469.1 unnamed protein product [Oppiella nova]
MAKDGKDSLIIKVNDISNEDSIKKYGQGMDQISGDINSIILMRQMVAIIHESIIRCEQYNHKLGLQLMDQMNKMQEYATNVRDKLLEMDNNLEDLKEKSKWKGRAAIRRLRIHRAKLCHRFVCCMIDYNNIQAKYKSKYIQLLRTQFNIAKLPVMNYR